MRRAAKCFVYRNVQFPSDVQTVLRTAAPFERRDLAVILLAHTKRHFPALQIAVCSVEINRTHTDRLVRIRVLDLQQMLVI